MNIFRILPFALCVGSLVPLSAAAPAAAPAAKAGVSSPSLVEGVSAETKAALRTALDAVEKAQSEDMYEPARVVVERTGDPTLFLPLMEEAAEKGSAAAQNWLTIAEYVRLRVEEAQLESDPRAVALRSRCFTAAKSDYLPAHVQASRLADMGVGAPADRKLAMRYLMEACKRNSPQARASYLLSSGRLQKEDFTLPEVASELKKGNFYVEEFIASAYGDTEKGVEWWRKARDHGSAMAPYVLTQLQAADLSSEEALASLKLAAERHYPTALGHLGALHLRACLVPQAGIPVEADKEGGLRLLKLAAALGDAEFSQSLATSFAQGEVKAPSVAMIARLYAQAAAMGDPNAMAGYGYCLMAGAGCPQDAAAGETLIKKALDKGAVWANQALASAYFNGLGVKPDMRRAVNALGEDFAMGSIHAYAIMAALTALGNEGAAPDPSRARIYLSMAVESGDEQAQSIYDSIMSAKGWRFLPGLFENKTQAAR